SAPAGMHSPEYSREKSVDSGDERQTSCCCKKGRRRADVADGDQCGSGGGYTTKPEAHRGSFDGLNESVEVAGFGARQSEQDAKSPKDVAERNGYTRDQQCARNGAARVLNFTGKK